MAPMMMESRYNHSVRLPKTFPMTNIDAEFTAGPAINSTSAAPGVNPFAISDTAIGIDPVAQTYMGMATARTISMFSNL